MNIHLESLRQLFPQVVRDGEVDVDALRELVAQEVGDVDERDAERFGLCWNGKRRSRQLALSTSVSTLRPRPDESVNWDATRHLFIEGENLEVLKLLQKPYYRQVKLIYIDPPYNTGHEFIYPDRFQESLTSYLHYSGQSDDAGFRVSANSDTAGRYHTNWLNMIYPRLILARNLLRDDGAIFISIDDNECHHLRMVCDEVFGEENFRATIAWQKRYTRSNNTSDFTSVIEYIHVYARSDEFKVNLLPRTEEADARYANPDDDDRGPWKAASFLNPATPEQRPNLCYEIRNPNTKRVTRPTTHAWRRSKEEFEKLSCEGRLYWGVDGKQAIPSVKMFLAEARGLTPTNFWSHEYGGCTDDGTGELKQLFEARLFDNPKPVKLIKRILEHASDADSLVLDFFAGSCTLPQAVMEMNLDDGGRRRFIAVQLPEPCNPSSAARNAGFKTIADIGRERIRRAVDRLRQESAADADLGYRAFRLSESNLRTWPADVKQLESSLAGSVEPIRNEGFEIDVIFELLLHEGIDLSARIDCHEESSIRLWVVNDGAMIVCLDSSIRGETAEAIRRLGQQRNVACQRVVLNDSGFIDDVEKANVVEMLTQQGIDVRCV